MRVNLEGKVYKFDPEKKERVTILDLLAFYLPFLRRSQRIWVANQAIKLKGIKVEKEKEVTNDNGGEALGGG